jgi:uncharacterized membrane protein SirB2
LNAYLLAKYLHVTCVAISGAGFVFRGALMLRETPWLRRPWLRIAPHVNDTLLLAGALAMIFISGQYPFVEGWLTAKVFGLIAYIALGSVALKAGRTKPTRTLAWLAAIGVFAYVVSVALTKNPLGFLALIAGRG